MTFLAMIKYKILNMTEKKSQVRCDDFNFSRDLSESGRIEIIAP